MTSATPLVSSNLLAAGRLTVQLGSRHRCSQVNAGRKANGSSVRNGAEGDCKRSLSALNESFSNSIHGRRSLRAKAPKTCQNRRGLVCRASASGATSLPYDGSYELPAPPAKEQVSLGRKVRAIAFYTWTAVLSIPLFIAMLIMHPFILVLDKFRRRGHHFVNNIWAIVTMALFYKVEIIGRENLPPPEVGAMFVANHQSFLDIFSLFALMRPFKFVSKTSIFKIPIIGWAMFLTGHVGLKRTDSRSQRECLLKCLDLLREGASVLFFPEGTRTNDGKMHQFKKGAFSIAAKAKAPVVPIAIIGTGDLMPNHMEGTLRPGKVTLVVLPPIVSKSADELCNKSHAAIAEKLVANGLGVA
eukprot:TRINITY_DN24075_c0_g1_i1.p1 TRINITY_DN24075_c0_g1~~TRINITY_DN24075_c0_g1_i1.p1  ORF type:complete len:358 (+),score=50.25 TRINITY_DN24075_c0_g1_i1:331-1404(+)